MSTIKPKTVGLKTFRQKFFGQKAFGQFFRNFGQNTFGTSRNFGQKYDLIWLSKMPKMQIDYCNFQSSS